MEVEERSGENAVFRSSFHLPLNKQRDPEGYFTAAGQMLLNTPPPPPHHLRGPSASRSSAQQQRADAGELYYPPRLFPRALASFLDSATVLLPPSVFRSLRLSCFRSLHLSFHAVHAALSFFYLADLQASANPPPIPELLWVRREANSEQGCIFSTKKKDRRQLEDDPTAPLTPPVRTRLAWLPLHPPTPPPHHSAQTHPVWVEASCAGLRRHPDAPVCGPPQFLPPCI